MDEGEMRELAETFEKGDKFKIGLIDEEIEIISTVMEDHEGRLHVEGEIDDYPDQGQSTSVYLTLPSSGDNFMINTHELEEAQSEFHDYRIGDEVQTELTGTHRLQHLEKVD